MKPLPFDNPYFLESTHRHNPAEISDLIDLPRSVLDVLPYEVRRLLPALQEAISIVFSSANRLDDLLSQRLERLIPLTDGSGIAGAECRRCE
jgi:hypothetical protein